MSADSLPIVVVIETTQPDTDLLYRNANFVADLLAVINRNSSESANLSVMDFAGTQVECHSPLHLVTKYYTAAVRLCRLTTPTIGSAEFATDVEAVVVRYDADFDADLKRVSQWLPFIKQWEPLGVRLLVCERVAPEKRVATIEWCVEESFELVELAPDEETLADAAECGELIGVERVVQALKAHGWSNLDLCERDDARDVEHVGRMRALLRELSEETKEDDAASKPLPIDITATTMVAETIAVDGACSAMVVESTRSSLGAGGSAAVLAFDDNFVDQKVDRNCLALAKLLAAGSGAPASASPVDKSANTRSHRVEESAAFNGVQHASDEQAEPGEEFETLFARFCEMRENAAALTGEERKAYAERVTVAFWNAIGGDPDELDEGSGRLSSDDEDERRGERHPPPDG